MKLLAAFVVIASVSSYAYAQNFGNANNLGNIGDPRAQASNPDNLPLSPQSQTSGAQNVFGTGPSQTMQANEMANQPAGTPDWRYRFYNGEWWYWTPQNSWMFYRGNQWNRYEASTFQPPARIVQSSPTYYNGYSNRGYYQNGPRYGYNSYGYGQGYGYGNRYGTAYRGYGNSGYGYNPYFSGNPNVRTGAAIGGAVGGAQGAYIGGAIGGAAGGGGGRGGRW